MTTADLLNGVRRRSLAMISPVRQEVLQALAELSEMCPEVRFGQLIANLSYMGDGKSTVEW